MVYHSPTRFDMEYFQSLGFQNFIQLSQQVSIDLRATNDQLSQQGAMVIDNALRFMELLFNEVQRMSRNSREIRRDRSPSHSRNAVQLLKYEGYDELSWEYEESRSCDRLIAEFEREREAAHALMSKYK